MEGSFRGDRFRVVPCAHLRIGWSAVGPLPWCIGHTAMSSRPSLAAHQGSALRMPGGCKLPTAAARARSFRGDQLSRPRWASRMGALSWGLDLATFEGVPVRLHGFEMADVAMLSSVFVGQLLRQVRGQLAGFLLTNSQLSIVIYSMLATILAGARAGGGLLYEKQPGFRSLLSSNSVIIWQVRGQLVGVALSFLRNFGVLSGASGVLGRLSASVAALGGGGPSAAEERLQSRQACLSPKP